MTSVGDKVFNLAINETISEWKSFQLCVENGMGGKDTADKLVWMSQVIHQFFIDNNDLMCSEVADFVAQIIDNEFDTIIEDGSLQMFASSLCKYYQLCSSGREEEVTKKLEDIRRLNNSSNPSNSGLKNDNKVIENGMQSLNISDESQQQNSDNKSDSESDGWTVVHRKHKK